MEIVLLILLLLMTAMFVGACLILGLFLAMIGECFNAIVFKGLWRR